MWSRRRFLTSTAAMAACGTGAARGTSPSPESPAAPPWTPRPAALGADFHRGMNFAHLRRRGWGYDSDRAAAQVARLKANGVTHLALNPFAYTRSLSSPTIEWGGDGSLTDELGWGSSTPRPPRQPGGVGGGGQGVQGRLQRSVGVGRKLVPGVGDLPGLGDLRLPRHRRLLPARRFDGGGADRLLAHPRAPAGVAPGTRMQVPATALVDGVPIGLPTDGEVIEQVGDTLRVRVFDASGYQVLVTCSVGEG